MLSTLHDDAVRLGKIGVDEFQKVSHYTVEAIGIELAGGHVQLYVIMT